jgi:hypothetical protein
MALLLLTPLGVSAQSQSSGHPLTITQQETDNDYIIKYRVSMPNGFGRCGGVEWHKSVAIRKDGSSLVEFGSHQGGWGDRTITVTAYPGAAKNYGAKYYSSSTLFNCHKWSTWYRYMRANNLKQPLNFRHLYEEENKQVVLTWDNVTNVPTGKYKIKIKRTDLGTGEVRNIELNGGTDRYVDNNNIKPLKNYRYEICTYFRGGYSVTGYGNAPERYSNWVSINVELPGIITNFEVDTRRTSIQFSWDVKNTYHHNKNRLEYFDGLRWTLVEEMSATTDQYNWSPTFTLIPGESYEFRVRAMDELSEIQKLSGVGGLSCNGVLSGHVKIKDSEKGVPNVPVNIAADVVSSAYVNYKYYEFPSSNTSATVDKLNSLTPVKSGVVSNFSIAPRDRNDYFGFVFEAKVHIKTAGNYTFYTISDDGSKLFINGNLVVSNDGTHPMQERSGSVTLAEGYHTIKVSVFENAGGEGLEVKYAGPGISKQKIPSAVLCKHQAVSYDITTDEEGYFYVDEIFYGEETKFTITTNNDSDIRPSKNERTLSVSDYKQDNVRFEDFSSKSVFGKVLIGECAIKDAYVMFNGEKQTTQSAADGSFEYVIQAPNPSDANTLSVFYKSHEFSGTIDLDLATDVENRNNPHIFRDIQKDTLILSVFSGCDKPIADGAVVELFTANESGNICKTMDITLDETGIDTLYLPAAKYTARVKDLIINQVPQDDQRYIDFLNVKPNIIGAMGELTVDLTKRDTVKKREIKVINAEENEYQIIDKVIAINLVKAPFVYRQSIDFKIEDPFWNNPTCTHEVIDNGETKTESVFVMDQQSEYSSKFKLDEYYDYYVLRKHRCGVDSASLFITDNISDRDQTERTIIDGTLAYTINPGEANIEGDWNKPHAFQKNLAVTARVPNYKKDIFAQRWALVTGDKILEPTFITGDVHMPQYILHDPPGDASFAYLEKGSSISTRVTFERKWLVGAEAEVNALFGKKFTGWGIGGGFYVQVEGAGGDVSGNESVYTTSFSETVSTNAGTVEPGEGSDVIIGTGMNFVYSKGKRLEFNCATGPTIDPSYVVSPGFQTRFTLSVYHVRNHILPTLDSLLVEIKSLEDKGNAGAVLTEEEGRLVLSKDVFTTSKANWKRILSDNRRQVFTGGNSLGEKEAHLRNVTFNGGTDFSYSAQLDTIKSNKSGYHMTVGLKAGGLFKVGSEDATYMCVDVKGGLTFNQNEETTTTTENSTVIKQGFTLSDNSVGDFFTINISKDPTYGTYIFQTVSGRSSCPTEPGTQTRDRAKITVISNPELRNLPVGKPATFKIRIDNDSQSEEGRIYSINSLTGLNDGSTISVGANSVNPLGSTDPFYLPADGSNEYIISVTPGSETRSLPIELVVTPECFASIYQSEDLLKAVEKELEKSPANVTKLKLFASWESSCDPIEIESPSDNWVVNTTTDRDLPLIIKGFDPNSTNMSSIEIQYRKAGNNDWSRLVYITSANVGEFPKKHMNVRVDTMDAGRYFVRAKTYCSKLNVANYSNVIEGVIDHNPFVAVDTNLENGWLRSESFRVTFSKPLASSTVRVQLLEESGNAIIEQQYVNAVINNNVAVIDIPDADTYEGFKYNVIFESGATLDTEGETLTTDKVYTMTLDRAEATWKVPNKVVILVKGRSSEFEAALINRGVEDAEFEIVSNTLSTYITPQYNSGVIPAGGEYPVQFDINNNQDIPVGTFDGSVMVKITKGTKVYYKTLQLTIRVKSVAPDVEQPDNKSYRMHLMAQFTPSATTDVPLSTDERDFITAYINGKVAGTSKIYFDVSANRHIAFVTIESDVNNPEISFKMWDASESIYYSAKETLTFEANTVKGNKTAPYILHANGAEQSIALTKGWNFVSFNVQPKQSSLNMILSGIEYPNTQIKNIKDGFSEYNPATSQWSGSLSTIDVNKAYKIYVDNDNVVKVKGDIVSNSYPVALNDYSNRRYNWVAVHNNNSVDIENAINRDEVNGGVVIRHEDQFAVLADDKSSWTGNLIMIEPGKGYELYNPNTIQSAVISEDMKLTFTVKARLQNSAASQVKAHIIIGGDVAEGYIANNQAGVPNAILDHAFNVSSGSEYTPISINLSDANVSATDFLKNHLQFFVRSDAYTPALNSHPAPDVEFADAVLEVRDRNNVVVYRYNYSKLMSEVNVDNFNYNWTGSGFKFKKTIVKPEYHQLLVGQSGRYIIAQGVHSQERTQIPEQSVTQASRTVRVEPNTMTLISQSYLNGRTIDTERYSVEAVINNEVVARNFIKADDKVYKTNQFFMLKAAEGSSDEISFRLVDNKTGEEFIATQTLNYQNDQAVGNIGAPYRIDFGGTDNESDIALKLYPNLVNRGEKVQLQILDNSKSVKRYDIVIVSMNGAVVYRTTQTTLNGFINTSKCSAGVYTVSVYNNKKLLGSSKLVVE